MKTQLSFLKKTSCNKLQGVFFSPFKVKLLLLFIILSVIIINPSYSQLVDETFDGTTFPPTGWLLVNNGSGNQWTRSAATTCSGAGSMMYGYHSTNAADCWAFTPDMSMTAGVTYRIEFYQRVATSGNPEKLKVTIGQGQTVTAQTTILWNNASLTNTTCTIRTIDYPCTSSGTYNVAFNCYSDANKFNLYVDEVRIVDVATLLTPVSPADGSYLASNYTYTWTWTGGTPNYKFYNTSGAFVSGELTGTSYNVNANEGVSDVPTASSYEWWASDGWDPITHLFGGTESSHNTYYLNRTLTPASTWQQAPSFTLPGTSSSFYYKIYMTAGNHYLFATCGHDHGDGVSGGSADFNTEISVVDAAENNLLINDDCGSGGNQSYIDYTCPSTETYYVKVYGYSGAFGTYALAYKTTSACSPLPVAPTSAISDRNNFCADDAGNINLSVTGGSGTTLRWFTGSCGGTDIGTGNPLTIASPATTTTYYARWENVCGNSTCASTAVTVNPLPDVIATPSSQTICSGAVTGISLTGGVSGTTFAWTVTQSGVTGATAGSGSSIAQTLTNSGTTAGTVTYTITPTASSCAGTSTNVVITVNPLPDVIATPSSQTINSGDATGISLTGNVQGTTFAWTVTQSGVTGATAGSGSSIAQTLTNSGTTAGTATYTITPTANNCSGTSINVVITVTPVVTGIENNTLLTDNMIIYPNPVKNQLYINLSTEEATNAQLKLTNQIGQIIYTENIVNNGNYNKTLVVSSFPKGIYFLQIITKENSITKKIVID